MNSFKLVAIEGVDSSGKETQTRLLFENLKSTGAKIEKIEFPNYSSSTSALVKMYLNGEFGMRADDVNPYTASAFFAVDRVGSIYGEWKERLNGADIVIADRYVNSNMIHQASKLDDYDKKDEFIDWVYDFEYNKLNLPKPDVVIFLDMPVKNALELMKNRPNKINSSDVKDIHESDVNYLQKSYDNALYVAKKYDWSIVSCVKNDEVRTIEDISNEIYGIVKEKLVL